MIDALIHTNAAGYESPLATTDDNMFIDKLCFSEARFIENMVYTL